MVDEQIIVYVYDQLLVYGRSPGNSLFMLS